MNILVQWDFHIYFLGRGYRYFIENIGIISYIGGLYIASSHRNMVYPKSSQTICCTAQRTAIHNSYSSKLYGGIGFGIQYDSSDCLGRSLCFFLGGFLLFVVGWSDNDMVACYFVRIPGFFQDL